MGISNCRLTQPYANVHIQSASVIGLNEGVVGLLVVTNIAIKHSPTDQR